MADITTRSERRRRGHGGFWRLAQLVAVGLAFRRRSVPAEKPAAPVTRPQANGLGDQPQADRDAPPSAADGSERGRHAEAPRQIPARGWKDVAIRSWKEFSDDQIPLISAGMTFYAILAIFPALGAVVSIYGLFADPADVPRRLQGLAAVLPQETLKFLNDQLTRIAGAHGGGLSLGFVGGLLLSVWSANGAMKALMAGLNIAYDEKEKRKFVAKTATSLALTGASIAFVILALAAVAVVPAAGRLMGPAAAVVAGAVAWPLVVAGLAVGLAVIYRYGPSRDRVKWRWISWGSGAATLLWLAFSALFSLYLANLADYNKTYGSLGAVIGFMMWVYFSCQVILLGAEVNSEVEHQTAKDTTVGPERPLGQRGAVMADSIGEQQGR